MQDHEKKFSHSMYDIKKKVNFFFLPLNIRLVTSNTCMIKHKTRILSNDYPVISQNVQNIHENKKM